MIISHSIRRQRGGLMILVMVVGLGIGLGLAALATFSTGQGEEAKRRITELKQTAAIQYATDYQLSDLASLHEEQTEETSNPAQVLENSKHLHSVDSSLLTTCLADMPWGTPPHNASGAVASLWNANDSVDPDNDDYAKNAAQLISAGTKEIPGVDREIKYAFEHYGRQLTTLNLDEDSWVEFRQLNDIAYDKVFFDIWFQVDFEDDSLFPYFAPPPAPPLPDPNPGETNEYDIPLASYYSNNGETLEASVYAKLSVCRKQTEESQERASECQDKKTQTLGILTYHIKQEGGPGEHLDEATDTIKSIEDGYWQYASFFIDLATGTSESNFTAVPQTSIDTSEDLAEKNFGDLDKFESGGVWKIADHASISSTHPIKVGAVRFWRQPSLSSASSATKALYLNDHDEPGNFHKTPDLGEPDAVLTIDGNWSDLRTLPDEDEKLVRQFRSSWWGPAIGQPTLITGKSEAEQPKILERTQQLFIQKRPANNRTGPPAPTQLYRLFTCDENGGAAIVEIHRNARRDDEKWNVSWKPQL